MLQPPVGDILRLKISLERGANIHDQGGKLVMLSRFLLIEDILEVLQVLWKKRPIANALGDKLAL